MPDFWGRFFFECQIRPEGLSGAKCHCFKKKVLLGKTFQLTKILLKEMFAIHLNLKSNHNSTQTSDQLNSNFRSTQSTLQSTTAHNVLLFDCRGLFEFSAHYPYFMQHGLSK